ncbi:hypothetical protein EI94DRAFT_1874052 [Lactarius quietus]|nr:hypothetical protein EI94DRAFT_1874052 [Lactarius quietus]
MVPREMPPLPDRRSVHYPGFDMHRDTHIALPCMRSMTRAREEAARVQEGEAAKENVRPMAGTVPCKSGKVKGMWCASPAPVTCHTQAQRHPLGNVWEFEDQMRLFAGYFGNVCCVNVLQIWWAFGKGAQLLG